jgi:parvulin-like peptidyl-prolyl isomerase
LTLGETKPLEVGQPIPEIGSSPEATDTIYRLRQGDNSSPIRTESGYAVLSVKSIEPSHPGTLAEVHDKVLSDYRNDKAVEMAKSEAQELARRAKGGEDLAKAAKSMGLEEKDSDALPRTGTITDVGTASQLSAAFTLPVGQTGDAIFLGANWVVYRVLDHQQPNPDDLAKQRQDITQQLLNAQREMAFEAFRTALDNRMKQDGTLRINAENMKRITTSATS